MPALIDTRKAFRRLQEQGGFTDDQADAIVDVLTDVDEQVATRGDIDRLDERIDEVESHLTQRIDEVESRLTQQIDEVESRFTQQIDEVESRLTQRIELSEERLWQNVEQVRSSITRVVVSSAAAVGAVLAVVIPLAMYLIG
jgi:uncharacterized membrane protein YheB (UPF0754 family)